MNLLRSALPAALAALLMAWSCAARAVLPIEHWTTSKGARVYFVSAPSIPMLDVSVGFDAGTRYDPPDKAGVASLTAALLAKGVPGLDEAAIAQGFASLGAERSGGANEDRAALSLRTLVSAQELDAALGLFERVMAEPQFPAQVLAREKERVIQALKESQVRPDAIAQRAWRSLLYPAHPYGQQVTPESVSAIGHDDLAAFHRERYGVSRVVVAMIGAVTRAQAQDIAERLTARLPAGSAPPVLPAVERPANAAERRIEHPSTQSHLLIGQPAIAWGDPDQFPLLVGNYVLGGGGFVSRLYNEVRERRGLAYSVYSYFMPSLQPGPFVIGLQTKREQTDVALGVVRETLDRFLADGPTASEVDAAKSNLVGGFALRIDSNRKILDYLLTIGFYNLPLDYLERWSPRVQAVTVAQIREAFERQVRPSSMVTVVVGAGTAVVGAGTAVVGAGTAAVGASTTVDGAGKAVAGPATPVRP